MRKLLDAGIGRPGGYCERRTRHVSIALYARASGRYDARPRLWQSLPVALIAAIVSLALVPASPTFLGDRPAGKPPFNRPRSPPRARPRDVSCAQSRREALGRRRRALMHQSACSCSLGCAFTCLPDPRTSKWQPKAGTVRSAGSLVCMDGIPLRHYPKIDARFQSGCRQVSVWNMRRPLR